MIIIDTKQKINRIDQKTYDKYTTRSMIVRYMHILNIFCFSIHGYYTRNIIDDNGNLCTITLVRINTGNRTHSLLLAPMIPFLPYSHDDISSISLDDIIPDDCPVSNYVFYYIKKCFISVIHDYKSICSRIISPLFVELLDRHTTT